MRKRVEDAGTGFVIALCLYSFFQDALGLEGYVAHCRAHWVSWVYSVPLALVALLVQIWMFKRR